MNASTSMPPVMTTQVVTSYATYCPEPTAITHNGVTYTVTEATTLSEFIRERKYPRRGKD